MMGLRYLNREKDVLCKGQGQSDVEWERKGPLKRFQSSKHKLQGKYVQKPLGEILQGVMELLGHTLLTAFPIFSVTALSPGIFSIVFSIVLPLSIEQCRSKRVKVLEFTDEISR